MKQLSIFLFGILLNTPSIAQVGIGTPNPSPSAVLDLTSVDKGLLIPRMPATNRINIASPANGLMVFDTDSASIFLYQQSGGWRRMLPVSTLGSVIMGNNAGDVLVWTGSSWAVTPKCNLFNFYFRDKDGDGKGDKYSPLYACAPLPGFIPDSTDCDDNNSAIGTVLQYQDLDGDGFGNPDISVSACTAAAGYASNGTDCNDNNPNINPGINDVPDDSFTDMNCDGIDGNESAAIFVSTASGNDANAGTKAAPVKTINAGITKAAAASKTQVLVAAGTYSGTVTMQSNISLYGGYSAANWTRSASNTVIINGQAGSLYAGVVAASVSNAILDRFTINAPSATGNTSGVSNSSYGIYGVSNSNFVVKNCIITAGSGAAGLAGAHGAAGPNGNSGSNGLSGDCDNNLGGSGGSGGPTSCSSAGGLGGSGGYNTSAGIVGGSGSGGTFGGNGGSSGSIGTGGTSGSPGLAGSPGAAGAGGSVAAGTVPASNLWTGSAGTAGGVATAGNGGGGGGGGGGGTAGTPGKGNGGGGGGSGGCAGGFGSAGTAGGGSFAVFFVQRGSGVSITNNVLTTSSGGNGGAGGNGAAGGAGGTGGAGGNFCLAQVGAGGNGGNGGAGGAGAGAGGGAGGASFGIYTTTPGITASGNSFSIGNAGTGGTGGTSTVNGGTAGVTGARGNIFQ